MTHYTSIYTLCIWRLAKEHNSDFSKVAIWTQIAAPVGALIPGFLLEDADENSRGNQSSEAYLDKFDPFKNHAKCIAILIILQYKQYLFWSIYIPKHIYNQLLLAEETNYSILFYACDVFLVIAAIMSLWLKVEMEKSGQTTKESLKMLWTRPTIIFFSFMLILGYGWGVRDTYLFAYLQDELGASSSLISKNNLKFK